MVVATQNPDLDYKAMANAGSWFIGRLQTENDKKRVLEGRSAGGGVDVDKLDTAIGGLEQRQFLLQSAHRGEPELFSTRWAMSFLRGPLTKEQIETPDAGRNEGSDVAPAAASPLPEPEATAAPTSPRTSAVAPAVAPVHSVRYLDPAAPWAASIGAPRTASACRPSSARVSLRYDDTKAGLDTTQVGGALRAARRRPRPRRRDHRRLRRPRLPHRAATARAHVLSSAPIDRSRSSATRRGRSSAASRTSRRSSSSAAGAQRLLPTRGAAADEPGGEIATGSRASTARSRPRAQGRGRDRAELAPLDRAPLRGRQRDRRPARRQGEHAHDRPRRAGARERRRPAREDDEPRGRAIPPRSGSRRPRPTSSARAGAARRGAEIDDRWKARRTRSRRSRSGSKHRRARRSETTLLWVPTSPSRAFAMRRGRRAGRLRRRRGDTGGSFCARDACHRRLRRRRRHDRARGRPPRPAPPGRRARALRRVLRPAAHLRCSTSFRRLAGPARARPARSTTATGLLRYVTAGATNVNVELVRRGAAAPYFFGGRSGRRMAAARGRRSRPSPRAACGARARRRAWSQAARS